MKIFKKIYKRIIKMYNFADAMTIQIKWEKLFTR